MSNVPIITLKARIDKADKLLEFGLRSDNYTTEPYIPPFLLANTNQLLDVKKSDSIICMVSSSGIHVHFSLDMATIERKDINLTHKEFEI
ncbi:Protein of unknown function [Bacillus cereus]|nr:Protein of unknown function [Bacillus cereus]